jgi:hypothetical protein
MAYKRLRRSYRIRLDLLPPVFGIWSRSAYRALYLIGHLRCCAGPSAPFGGPRPKPRLPGEVGTPVRKAARRPRRCCCLAPWWCTNPLIPHVRLARVARPHIFFGRIALRWRFDASASERRPVASSAALRLCPRRPERTARIF